MMHSLYPFPALVGQEQLKTALCLAAVNPFVGGVLIRGEKGTAKSTAARALARLLPPIRVAEGCPFRCAPDAVWDECPHCGGRAAITPADAPVPFVTLPLGATEDRVLGTLDFERALREGRRAFEPGLLATAHRGILYIDEVNLLSDHLVDVLLDAAAMGVSSVQREGMSVVHPAQFTLIGTMNPEEGELRPQFLDRFGLSVDVKGPREPSVRAEVVRRRVAFEADPGAFADRWADDEARLRARLLAARALLPEVALDDDTLEFIARLCSAFEVDGLRADIVLHKTARTLAAFEGQRRVTVEHVRAAAELVLPHRMRRRPFEQPALDRERLDERFAQASPPPPEPPKADPTPAPGGAGAGGRDGEAGPVDSDAAAGGSEMDQRPPGAAVPRPTPRLEIDTAAQLARLAGGRRKAAGHGDGRYLRAVPDAAATDVAVDATLRAAAVRGGLADGQLEVTRDDVHRKVRDGRTGTLILFALDASGSVAARQRVEAARGAVLGLLTDAYQRRDLIGMVAFRGPRAELVIPPTNSVELAQRALDVLPTGGRTPLAHALQVSADVIGRVRRDAPDRIVLLVVITDGKANVPLPGTAGDPWLQAAEVAESLAAEGITSLVLDSERAFVHTGRAEELASRLAGRYMSLAEFSGERLLRLVEGVRG